MVVPAVSTSRTVLHLHQAPFTYRASKLSLAAAAESRNSHPMHSHESSWWQYSVAYVNTCIGTIWTNISFHNRNCQRQLHCCICERGLRIQILHYGFFTVWDNRKVPIFAIVFNCNWVCILKIPSVSIVIKINKTNVSVLHAGGAKNYDDTCTEAKIATCDAWSKYQV